MKKQIILSAILIAASLITLNSCKKKTEVDNETQSVVDNAVCEQQFMAIAPTTNGKGVDPRNPGFKVSACGDGIWVVPNVSGSGIDTLVDATGAYTYSILPTFTLDYSGTTCADADGIIKKGKIMIKSTHMWSKIISGSTAVAQSTVTFSSYKVDGVQYEGTVILTKSTSGSTTKLTTQVIDGVCTGPAGWVIHYNCNKTLTKESDGSYSIQGSSNGINREGRKFDVQIIKALIKKKDCKWISSGILELTPDGFKTRTVDFGDSTCDNKATFTVNGQTVEFKMQ